MALFKIFKGPQDNLGTAASNTNAAHEGYAYFTTDNGKFYIDIADAATAQIGVNRIPLSADKADKDDLGNIIKNTYAASLNLAGHTLKLIAKDGTTVLSTITLPDGLVTQTEKTDNAEYKILTTSSTSPTSGSAAGVGYDTDITINPSTSTITAGQFEGDLRAFNIKPTISKVYASTSYYATAANQQESTWYFMSIRPTSWYQPWRVRFKVHSFEPSYLNANSVTYCTVSGREQSFVYANWNERYDSAHYYTSIYPMKKAGFDAGYGHAIGISILYGYNYTNSAHYRTFEVDYFDCDGCTVELLDTPVKWGAATWLNNSSLTIGTYYNGVSNMDATSRGLQESGDANNYDRLQMSVTYPINGSTLRFPPYTLFGYSPDGKTQSFSLYNAGYTSSTTGINTARVYNTAGIDWTRGINYYTGGSNLAVDANLNISIGTAWSAIDFRYSDNCVATTATTTLGLVQRKPVYFRGTIESDGLFHIAPLSVTYNNSTYQRAWTQDIPTAEDGYVYWFIGYPYYNSSYASGYQIDLFENNPLYWYHNGSFQQYTPNGGVADSVPWSGITDKPSTFTPSSHSHGNITNAGELSTANRVVITDGNKKITISSVTSTELGYLSGVTSAIQTQLNAKAPLASPVLTGTPTAPTAAAGTNTTQIATTAFVHNAVSGLSGAMHFRGTTTSEVVDGSTTNPITINGNSYTAAAGDVVLREITTGNIFEYVWTGSAWEMLGRDTSFKVQQTAVTDPTASGSATAFINTISQDANGVITVTKKNLPSTVLATDTGTSSITLAHGGKYKLTAAGSSVIFTMPSDNNTTYTFANGTDGSFSVTPSGGSAQTVSIGKPATAGTADVANSVAWSNVTGKPSSFTPSSHTHYELATQGDNRGVATTPNDYANRLVFRGLKTNSSFGSPSTDTYSYVVGLRGWSDSSGGNSHELAFNNTGIFWRSGATTSWGSWYRIYTTGNKPTASDVGLGNVTNHQQVHEVAWDSTNKKVTRSKNGTANDVVQFKAGTNISLSADSASLTITNNATDTLTGTPGAGKTITAFDQVNGAVTATFADIAITKSQITDFPTSMTPASHTHGNITNDGKLGTASVAVVTDGSKNITTADLSVTDPTASGTGITYIATISQNGQGKITATKSTVRSGTTSQTGVVQLTDSTSSTSTTTAATPNSVKSAYDLANNHKYWANVESTSAAAYNKTPEVAKIKLNGNTSASAASTKNVELVYDATLEVLNFVFS